MTRIGTRELFAHVARGGLVRRNRATFKSVVAAAAVAISLLAAGYGFGDDFERLVNDAQSEGTVAALVTGWHAITGEEVLQGSSGAGPVAITGDEFVEQLRAGAGQAEVIRRYENFPVLAMRMDPMALRQAKSYRGSVEVWKDPVLEPLLWQSTLMVGADEAWRRGYTGEGVAVAVIDDGADVDHPFLQGRVIFEACFADRCPNGERSMVGQGAAFPAGTHGTHVSGIVLGRSDRLSGVGPDLRLIIINVANRTSRGMSGSSILGGLDTVITLAWHNPGLIGAVTMSLGMARNSGGVCRSWIWDLASRLLRDAGVAVAAASGNDSKSNRAAPVGFPACIEGFISVGAVTKTAQVADFSNSGPTLELLAPGVAIHSSIVKASGGELTREYESLDGTSMAAPHVAAALALLHQAAPGLSVAERVEVLKESGRPIKDSRNGVTVPLIDVGRAVAYLRADESGGDQGSSSDTGPEAPQPDGQKEQWTPITG